MKIYLTDQQPRSPQHLEQLRSVPIMPYQRDQLREKSSSIVLGPGDGVFTRAVELVQAYRIFPPAIMCHLTEWSQDGREMRIGDTIVQQVHIPPLLRLSQKLVFGVRVSSIIAEPDRRGFTYETLVGHVEKGLSTFTVERAKKEVLFRIHTFPICA